ncbi:MAG: hypothetical protein ABIR08_09155 [Sphingomonas sp.]
MTRHPFLAALFGAALMLPAMAAAQDAPKKPSDLDEAGKIVSQPARDVGIAKTKIPPVLELAAANPYTLSGLSSCSAMAAKLGDLDQALGADFDDGPQKGESLAKAGGKAVVNSIMPFRGVIREISGAAAADRRLAAATDAGIAQRGFLRGVYQTRGCKRGR